MARRPIPLQLEELGDRILPSATPILLPELAPSPPAHLQHPAAHSLSGHGEGSYTFAAIQSGAGIDYHLQGTAHLGALGNIKVSGSVHSVGFVVHGHAEGTLTFTNSHGSVTIDVQGPDQPGFSPLPEHFSYRIVGGTGSYAHL